MPRHQFDLQKHALWLILAIYLTASLLTLAVWHARDLYHITGDEPHYLVTAHGIASHGVLEQTLPYAEEFRNRTIFPPGLAAPDAPLTRVNTHAVPGPHGWFSVHNLGLPVLLALPYLLGGVTGAKLMMILLGALVVIFSWKVSGVFSSDAQARFWATLAASVTLPLLLGGGQIYPDVLAGALALGGLYWVLSSERRRSPGLEMTWMAAIVFLPWLQLKFAPACALVVAALALRFYREDEDRRRLAILLSLALLSWLTLAAYNHYAFGNFAGPYHAGVLEASPTSLMVLLGLHLDQNHGLLLQSPITLVGVAALGGLYRFNKKFALLLGLVYFSLIVPNAMHTAVYGAHSFSGRFNLPAAMVFLIPVLYGLLRLSAASPKTFRIIIGLSLLAQIFFFCIYTFGDTYLYNKLPTTSPRSYSDYFGVISAWLPMLYNVAWAPAHAPNYAWLLLTGLLLAAGLSAPELLRPRIVLASVIGAVAILAAGVVAALAPLPAQVFPAKDLPSQTGRLQDAARIARHGVDGAGFTTYGPYALLGAGHYKVILKYSSTAPATQTVAKLDVFDASASAQRNELPVRGTGGQPAQLEAGFDATHAGTHLYEFRTLWNGEADLKVIEIVLQPQ